jgi:hypothetical protein
MWPISTGAQVALGQSHGIDSRATITHPVLGTRVVPISGGSVTSDGTSNVRTTGEITVDPSLWPKNPFDLLSPFGAVCLLEYGIVIPGIGTEWVPLGTLVLDESSRSRPITEDAAVTVKLVDYSARIAEDRFDAPTQTIEGATAVAEISRLVHRTLPDVTVIDQSGSRNRVVAQMEMQSDPWADGIEKLSTAIACEVFFNPLGNLVIRPQPTLDDVPVWYARTGDSANILNTKEILGRSTVYNRVFASGQRSDSIPPVSAIAQDTDPLSPTRVGGPFGTKTRKYASQLLTTVEQCQAAADSLLQRVRGASFSVDFEILANPALIAGDVIRLDDADLGPGVHIIDKVTIPLSPDGAQSITTRSDDLPAEQ